jgi:DNA replication protein DnaD
VKKIKLTEKDLHKLTTRRLLKYRDSLLACHETEDDDTYRKKVVKSSDEWREHYALVKSILATREHI